MKNKRLQKRRLRSGYTVVEITICVLIMAAILVIVGQAVVLLGRQQQTTQCRLLAMQEVSNAMERVATLPFDSVDDETLKTIDLSEQASQKLRDPRLLVEVKVGDRGESKRVLITLDWNNAAGQRVQSLRLVSWRYRLEEDDK